jgi:hypothetical protein
MGFTRSTTTTNVHSTLGDYPSVDDGLTPEQLKARFDSPATGLKGDINNLEDELEASTAAASLGAAPITASDASSANVQAKLEKIYQDLQDAALGVIPDNSVAESKLVSSYSSTLAKKDNTLQTNLNADKLDGYHASSFALKNNTLQTNLNAEKLGGKTLAQITAMIEKPSAEDTNLSQTQTSSGGTEVTNTYTKTVTVASRYILFLISYDSSSFTPATYGKDTGVGLFDVRSNKFIIKTAVQDANGSSVGNELAFKNVQLFTQTLSSGAGSQYAELNTFSYSDGTLTFKLSFTSPGGTHIVYIKCIQLDGLMP